ncbi:polyphosphate kinase 1 [Allomuricauda sp. d1]|uniref:polyphosphate kinase 1 n=1 Tax=Allomuricauda sp. d1 TaxID=3136725 RepID=UPI0031D156F4
MQKGAFKNRDVNWLYFNERVLLEAQNEATPLLERLKFLAIFSSNLDEYFKVRISQMRQLKSVEKSLRKRLILKPNKKLKFILKTVDRQQQLFGETFRAILKALEGQGIHFKKPEELTQDQRDLLAYRFTKEMMADCTIHTKINPDKLQDGSIYMVCQFEDDSYALVHVPSGKHQRFTGIPGGEHDYIFIEDVIKMSLSQLFLNRKTKQSYAIKLSRDAELYLDDEADTELAEKIYQSLPQRKSGQPTRLLYDANMPKHLQQKLRIDLQLGEADMFPGGEYHNLSDFFGFQGPEDAEHLRYEPKPPLDHPVLSYTDDFFRAILEKDRLIHPPYQSFAVVERFFETAASDADVTCMMISLYRIAKSSKLTDAILKALDNGKKVVIFVEAQARFDEKNNIEWGRTFEEKGAQVVFSVPNIKVHSKIAMVERLQDGEIMRYAFIGTGNFNAKTAKIYCDHGLFTANKKITGDLNQVFLLLQRELIAPKLKYLLVSPFTTRSTFLELIHNEIFNAQAGRPAKITAKMNSLEDSKMIEALYRASEAGVEVRLLVRGFCCLIPKTKEVLPECGKPIYVTSIIDRYLEHGRIYLFENDGDEKMYIGSADWMTRNLDKRVEVLAPILDPNVFAELKDILQLQLNDNVKARVIDAEDSNTLVEKRNNEPEIRSQYAIYEYLKAKLDEDH